MRIITIPEHRVFDSGKLEVRRALPEELDSAPYGSNVKSLIIVKPCLAGDMIFYLSQDEWEEFKRFVDEEFANVD